ncbi:hypothetical protein, conserved [Eimeria praecox]|uniref:Uncharacterized protein n=1 Tax=Eimeria praecox TaxID=51316 RepID=U6GVA4_9EIME|nr:hypothetical protein, conserved [Eimeria praecox]
MHGIYPAIEVCADPKEEAAAGRRKVRVPTCSVPLVARAATPATQQVADRKNRMAKNDLGGGLESRNRPKERRKGLDLDRMALALLPAALLPAEHKPLRHMLQQVQGRAEDMCLPHEDGFSSGIITALITQYGFLNAAVHLNVSSWQQMAVLGYKATYRLKDGTSATVNVTLVEVFFGSTGPPDPRFKYFYGDGQGFGHKHLGRDVGCILEEMVTQALSEAASTGGGRITETINDDSASWQL